MSKINDLSLLSTSDDDSIPGDRDDADDCDALQPLDVSLLHAADGSWHVALVYIETIGQAGDASCSGTGKIYVQVAHLGTDNKWTLAERSELTLSTSMGAVLERVPCRDEWIVGAQRSGSAVARRMDATGMLSAEDLDVFGTKAGVVALHAAPTDCSDSQVLMYVGFASLGGTGLAESLRRWQIDRVTGAVSRPEGDMDVGIGSDCTAMAFAGRDNRLFSVIADRASGSIEVWELAEVNHQMERRQAVYLANDGDPTSHIPDPGADILQIRALTVGNALVIGSPRGQGGGNLESYRAEGDTDPPSAVTYRVGCP
jgi:hypothetical protein